MSASHERYWSCERKRRYEMERTAAVKAWADKMRYYHCNFCAGYHLTSRASH